ncbi:MAG TPA: thioredoxin domain-containing protein [Candidatus Binataceae bacterium]|nr:thioredoxin domain-containing protein [Candidatus Binataceae bacterium]
MDCRVRRAGLLEAWRVHRIAGVFLLISVTLGLGGALAATDQGGSGSAALATVGSHQITQQEVDEAVLNGVSPTQLYDLRKRALDRLVDDYVVDEAAKKAGLSPDQYLAKQVGDVKVTDADARKFYDAHKKELDSQTKGQTFDQIKGRLIAALEHKEETEKRAAVIAKLRDDAHVDILMKPARSKVNIGNSPWSGGKDAAVTVVEFSDFQCPYCRAAEGSVKQITGKYGDRIKFVYMNFPLSFHEHAMDAARAASCAAEQDKFWPYHDALFADQSKLTAADLKVTAKKLNLDTKKFDECFDKGKPDAAIKADMAQGQSLGVTGTPTFFINGREIVGAQSADKLSEVIDDEMKTPTKAATKAD